MTVENVEAVVTIVAVKCGMCDTWVGLELGMRDRAFQTGELFHCPKGHRVGWRNTENDRLKQRLADAQRREESANARAEQAARRAVSAEMSRRVTKGHLTRVKQRVAAGVCPCCNRTFADLARHMAGQHPEYATEATR